MNKKQTNQQQQKTTLLASPSFLPLHLFFTCVGGSESCCGTLLFQQLHLQMLMCDVSLVRFKARGFWYIISAGPSSNLLSDTLQLSRALEIPWLWFHRTSPYVCSSRS